LNQDINDLNSDTDSVSGNMEILQSLQNEGTENLLDAVPVVDELIHVRDSIKAVENACLDNGDLSADVVAQIRSPPQDILTIEDPSELYSLKQYLAAQGASQHVYMSFHNNHNEVFPEMPMLSYEQIQKKVAHWSGIQPIISHTVGNKTVRMFGGLGLCI
jgi:hypothetical protein